MQDTHTDERSALEAWFARQRERGEPLRSPKMGGLIQGEPLWFTNHAIKAGAQEWKGQKQQRGRGRKGF